MPSFSSTILSLIGFSFPFFLLSLSVADLSLEEKVGQILMVHINGREADEEAAELVQQFFVGGIIYYNWANGLTSPEQVLNLSNELQRLTRKTSHKIPLFIAVDQEGGKVNRLKEGFTIFPGNDVLGRTENWGWGKESARMIGTELKAVGVSMNLAPVVDVFSNPKNQVIGARAFSAHPYDVAKWGSLAMSGYKEAGVIAVIKHFPGLGDVHLDPHESLPILGKTIEELEDTELVPFHLLAAEADVIMTSHLLVPALDPELCVTLSQKVVEGILRETLDFQGVIMTDSLTMQGLLNQCPVLEEAALKAFEAGHDMILLGGKQLLDSQSGFEFHPSDFKRVHQYFVDAVKGNRISESRMNASVNRILELKKKYGLFEDALLDPKLLPIKVGTQEHISLAEQIAEQEASMGKNGKGFL